MVDHRVAEHLARAARRAEFYGAGVAGKLGGVVEALIDPAGQSQRPIDGTPLGAVKSQLLASEWDAPYTSSTKPNRRKFTHCGAGTAFHIAPRDTRANALQYFAFSRMLIAVKHNVPASSSNGSLWIAQTTPRDAAVTGAGRIASHNGSS